jgi:putative acetyltransferase
MTDVLVRREQAADVVAVRAVVAAAFALPDAPDRAPVEVGLLDRLRADDAWIPALSLVAVDASGERVIPPGEQVVGHVVCTRASLDGRAVLGLGPLAVRPDRQRQGVGGALMYAVLAAAEARDEPLVGLLGDPAYYRRFGFKPASHYGIVPPDPGWGAAFQVRLLSPERPVPGTFGYARPFRDL